MNDKMIDIIKLLYSKLAIDELNYCSSMDINSNFCLNSKTIFEDVLNNTKKQASQMQQNIVDQLQTKEGFSLNGFSYSDTFTIGSYQVPNAYVIFKCVNDAIMYANVYRDLLGQLIKSLFVPTSSKSKIRYFDDLIKLIDPTKPPVLSVKVSSLINYINNSSMFNYVHEYCNIYKHNNFISFDLSYDLFNASIVKQIKEFDYHGKHLNSEKDIDDVLKEINDEIINIETLLLDVIKTDYLAQPDKILILNHPVYSPLNPKVDYNPVRSDVLIVNQNYMVTYATNFNERLRMFKWKYNIIPVVDSSNKPIGYLSETTNGISTEYFKEYTYKNNITDNEILEVLNGIKKQSTYVN